MTLSVERELLADRLRAVRRMLRRGELVCDRAFDDVFPLAARRASSVHWTPIEVALRAATLLTDGVKRPVILDVGAGVGKFCLAARCAVDAEIRGLEHRAHFVEIARAAAARLDVDVRFSHGALGDAGAGVARGVTGFYLFNPFAENLAAPGDHLDETVELTEDRYWRDVRTLEAILASADVGTRVVTYCGFGGTLPEGYVLAARERRAGRLELWEKLG